MIPLKQVAVTDFYEEESDAAKECHENIVGEEADAIMIILMLESEDAKSLHQLHDEVGHSIFVTLALNDNKKHQVDKIHRYFGH